MIYLFIVLAIGVLTFFVLWQMEVKKNKQLTADSKSQLATKDEEIARGEHQKADIRQRHADELKRFHALGDERFAAEAKRIGEHYAAEANRIYQEAYASVSKLTEELEPLRKFQHLMDAEMQTRQALEKALADAAALQRDAEVAMAHVKDQCREEKATLAEEMAKYREQVVSFLAQGRADAERIVAEAKERAEKIGGDAYRALEEKDQLERTLATLRRQIEEHADEYLKPSRNVLDDVAIEFGLEAAAERYQAARLIMARLIAEQRAAQCDYVEEQRKIFAIRFVVDAFNGRVDTILSRARASNQAVLEEEIREAHNMVNLNGQAFKNARITDTFLEARLDELRWACALDQLRQERREEEREVRERLRDEEIARRQRDRAMKEAMKEEESKRQALAQAEEASRLAVEEARKKFEAASAEERAAYEAKLTEVSAAAQQQLAQAQQQLTDATQRKLTVAQQRKKGFVYVISNEGSFGCGVFKVGQTRRDDPQERIYELGDASVPFPFDLHALVSSENAPILEHLVHREILKHQINKVNARKEFFRVDAETIKRVLEDLRQKFTCTVEWKEHPVSLEHQETMTIEKDPQKLDRWLGRMRAKVEKDIEKDEQRRKYLEKEEAEDLEAAVIAKEEQTVAPVVPTAENVLSAPLG